MALPEDPDLSPEALETLLARSHEGEPREFRVSAVRRTSGFIPWPPRQRAADTG